MLNPTFAEMTPPSALGQCAGRLRLRAALQNYEIVGMGKVQDGAGALIQHVRVEAFGPEQSDVALEPRLYLFEAGKLALEHVFAALQIGAGVEPMIADFQMVAEIAADTAGEQRKNERAQPHLNEGPKPLAGVTHAPRSAASGRHG
jgi:hypothetical protein